MNKHIVIVIPALMMFVAACNHSDTSESFRDFTTSTFALAADDEPVDIDNRNFDFDIDSNDIVIDQLIENNDFSV